MSHLISRIKNRLCRDLKSVQIVWQDTFRDTYILYDGVLNAPKFSLPPLRQEEINALTKDAFITANHEFDLLGSGNVKVKHGITCAGFNGNVYENKTLRNTINRKNKFISSSILKNIKGDYELIDWQLDFKSGYRWQENKHSRLNKIGKHPGADVKVPWELARLEHLPRLALLYSQTKDERLALEFQNQTLDFIANNPPRYGVNWLCTMDVAIRISNIILAYWMFKNAEAELDARFERIISASVYMHGVHIIENLEYVTAHLNNHYFSNICGLLFVALALPSSPRVDSWLAYGVQEFKKELTHQFDEDGANFEASTAYHCLSTEMAVYTLALLLGNKAEAEHRLKNAKPSFITTGARLEKIPSLSLPDEIVTRFYGMRHFIDSVTKNNGNIHQVGDNDSGHFFTPSPEMITNPLHRATLSDAVRSLWTNKTTGVEAYVVKLLRGEGLLPVMDISLPTGFIGKDEEFKTLKKSIDSLHSHQKATWTYALKGATENKQFGYQHFGLYGWKSDDFYCAVRCGSVGQDGHGGHAHADQLAIELQDGDKSILADVGSYIYTAAPSIRNQYRATAAHSGPKVRGIKEPANLESNIFHLPDTFKAECLYWGPLGFIGTHVAYGEKIYRMITIGKNEVTVTDAVFSEKVKPINFVPNPPAFSSGYGQKCAINAK
jgi:hypothetical protein